MFKKNFSRKEKIPGGKADGMTPDEFDPEQLKIGKEIQMEHTDDPDVAQEITMDHLVQFDNYYDGLIKMENDLKKQKHYTESIVYLKSNTDDMKNINTKFDMFVNENRKVTPEMRLNRDNKFRVVIEYDEDIIKQMDSYNITKSGDDDSGDWILYNSLDKTYGFLNSNGGEIIMDKNDISFFTERGKPDSAYRIINMNMFHRMMDGL